MMTLLCRLSIISTCIIWTAGEASINGCTDGGNKACIRSPRGCSLPSCQYFISYEVRANDVLIEMSTSVKWMAAGTNMLQQMKDTTGFACSVQQKSGGHEAHGYIFLAEQHKLPLFKKADEQQYKDDNISVVEERYVNGILSCSFTRPKTRTSTLSSMDSNSFLIGSFGQEVLDNGQPRQHTPTTRFFTDSKVTLTTKTGLFEFDLAVATTPSPHTTPSSAATIYHTAASILCIILGLTMAILNTM